MAQTLNFVYNPGTDTPAQAAGEAGSIVNSVGGGGVNWYSFTLDQASDVQLASFDVAGGTHLNSVVSLFQTEAFNPFYSLSDTAPPFEPQQYRMLDQVETTSATTPGSIERQLAAGTYYVAVSGAGDEYFNPYLADSGYAGSTGDYQLLVTAQPLPIQPADGPAVLAVDPGLATDPNSVPVLTGSPLAIAVDFSSPIDPTTVSLLQPGSSYPADPPPSVQLTFNPTGQFGDGDDAPVFLNGFNYAPDIMELQLQLAAPLGPGYYQLTLAGNPGPNFNPVITDPTDTINLGQNSANPEGQDFTSSFEVVGNAGPHDTAATAYPLGDITQAGLVQASGAIGDNPAYNPFSSSPNLSNPAAQVNTYNFQISGAGQYEFGAEVFAGRIGSTLQPALSLFRYDPSDSANPLQFLASNEGTSNTTLSSNGQFEPLFTDPVLDVGLTAGDYYVAVSSAGNMPDFNGNAPGTNGVFDPTVSYSGANGSSTGNYVLNLLVQPAAPAPHVVSTSIEASATLTSPPTQLTVDFDSYVNVVPLANAAFAASAVDTVSGVYFLGSDGQTYYPRLESYDYSTNQATFLLLDRLPNGPTQLVLSGAGGLAGHGGTPLAGNDPSGDCVVPFTIADPHNPADPLNRTGLPAGGYPITAEDLGVLFPHEVESGVTVTGTLAAAPAGSMPATETYTLQQLELQQYQITLTGPPADTGTPNTSAGNLQLTVTNTTLGPVTPLFGNDPTSFSANLVPGTYTIQISWGSSDNPSPGPYQLQITMLFTQDNPPPLSIGATPVLQIRLASNPPPASPILGPESVIPAAHLTSSTPAGSQELPSGNNLFALAALDNLALSLRAGPLGGVTSLAAAPGTTASSAVQVKGLTSVPASLAANSILSGSEDLSALLVVVTTGLGDPSLDATLGTVNVLWASGKKWLATWSSWIKPLPGPESLAQRPIQAEALSVPPLDVQNELPGDPKALVKRGPLQEGAASAASYPLAAAEPPPANSGDDAGRSGTSQPGRAFPWVGVLVSTALAVFLLGKRAFHAAELLCSLSRRKPAEQKRPVDLIG